MNRQQMTKRKRTKRTNLISSDMKTENWRGTHMPRKDARCFRSTQSGQQEYRTNALFLLNEQLSSHNRTTIISCKQEQRRHHKCAYTVPFNTSAAIKTTFSWKQNVKMFFYDYFPFSGITYLHFIHFHIQSFIIFMHI